ncbi:MAG: 8-amino-7-oxononanoate synthase [Bacteroidetes bacterium]|nr:MAG: 8-amino-7-oxononanoate synthase [Bacteroidota bacterium]
MDLFDKITKNWGPLGKWSRMGHGYFFFPKLEGKISNKMTFKGEEMLVWSTNNYLGLADHPEVRKADADAAAEYGMASPMGSRMMSGNTDLHEQLDSELSDFVGKEKTILLNYGYQGMVSAIDCLVDRHDVIVYDSESHACIVDGVRLHQGKRFVFPHNNIEKLENQLKRAKVITDETKGGILVITEGVFGMAGDLSKLKEITALKSKYNFRLFVDDAHGFGTMGKTGAGTGEHCGVQDLIDIYFGTFAKAMASIGAFISSEADIIGFLRYNSRSQIYAKSLPLPLVVGALKRLELLRTKPELKESLWKITNALQSGFKKEGFDLGDTESCVTPVYISGALNEASNLLVDLRQNHKIFCSIVVYPVVPKDTIMLRVIPTAIHTLENVEYTVAAFKTVKKNLDAGQYAKQEMGVGVTADKV